MEKTTIVTTRFKIKDLDHPTWHPETFGDFEGAKEVLDKEYTNRNKGDGHDEYWRNRNTGIEKVITETEILFSNKNKIK